MRTRLVVPLLLATAAAARAQMVVSMVPPHPLQGALVYVVVQADTAGLPPAGVHGELAGEPLHFERDRGGAWRALAAVPIDARDSVVVRLALRHPDGVMNLTAHTIAVAPRAVGREVLRTDPRFTTPPDSALRVRLERERRLVQAVLERAHQTPRLWHEPFAAPRPGEVRSGFGTRREFNGSLRSRHLGVDLPGGTGDPVRATNRGVVALVGDFYYSGQLVFVNHGAGLVTAYLHLSRAVVAVGDTVERDQVVGHVGATGRVTGPHLHWLARYGGVYADPRDLLALDVSALVPVEAPAGAP